jgi:acyl-coenzyme A synthetase/AMP-(fatty) acid ligase
MKRAVICVSDPWNYIPKYDNDYSIMVINPAISANRKQYLLDKSDYSLLVTSEGEQHRAGGFYPNERVRWYTSGTTGDSKFYNFSYDQIAHTCERLKNAYKITANDRYVNVMPLWHAHGQMFYWLSKQIGFEINFLPIAKLSSIEDYSPTFVTAVPDILKVLTRMQLPDLRFVRSASSPLPDKLHNMFKQSFGVPVIEAFGMTESCSHCFTNPLEGEQRAGTIGLPDGVEAEIRQGRLFIRGPGVVKLDWFDTQDLAEQDEQGYFKIIGRAVDTINVRGVKFNPMSLEQQLLKELETVTDCVIFGSTKVKCLYVGTAQPTEIKNFLSSLDIHCTPVLVERVDTIPLNSMGKVSRSMLDKEYQ